ncbi:apical rhoptry neck protein [Plasmodium gonderi]|uniref:Apical rhoptry neck protein n=1 Tax=Plasmodium gonderi TaxID=77519 RepID=A0A1Y1JFZ3_PLAGO|nr:apical rhoptry neck protein [Plasmodium gonderi]GAW81441.1 apical rhoptry neck protein [Plasmodium gonderi]
MKKMHSFFFPLFLSLAVYFKYIKLTKCFMINTKRNVVQGEWKHSMMMPHVSGTTEERKTMKKQKSAELEKTNMQQLLNEEKHNIRGTRKKDMLIKGEGKKKDLYSFMSLKFMPFLANSFPPIEGNSIPTQIEPNHTYNFEKSPTIRYMLIAQERRDNFMYIFFIVISFVVVVLIAIFVFKFFFNL